jgi:hypothetical protein
MKRLLSPTIFLLFFISILSAQPIPRGMNYQAVARNLKGEILPNEMIALKINLVSNHDQERRSYFSETHTVTTNALGLFSLIIGEGTAEQGTFNDVPWSTENIWMEVAIKDKTQPTFSTISNSKLLAVPYAMHAVTANTLVGDNTVMDKSQGTLSSLLPTPGVISTNWSVFGNAKTDASGNIYRLNSLGTTDFVDLFLITDNVERLRITAGGDIITKLNFEIGKSVVLNSIGGSTTNNGPFTVAKMSPANLTGILNVDKTTRLNDSLIVNNMKPAIFSGSLRADKKTTLNDTLTVTNMKPTYLTGSLTVDKDVIFKSRVSIGAALSLRDSFFILNMAPALLSGKLIVDKQTLLKDSLTVLGVSSLNNKLIVTKDVPDGDYLATFNNTNNGAGDGINIKLGKLKTVYAPPPFVDTLSTALKTKLKNLLNCEFPSVNKPQLLADILIDGELADLKFIGGLTVGLGNLLINEINTKIGLPFNISAPINTNLGLPWGIPSIPIWPGTELFGGLRLRTTFDIKLDSYTIDFGSIPRLEIPKLDVPAVPNLIPALPNLSIPAIPNISLASLGIPAIPLNDLAFWGIPSLCLSDAPGSNPLNNENVYIRFSDKDNKKMGSIRAVSLSDWASNYLNPIWLNGLYGAWTSCITDKKHGRYHGLNELTKALKDYASIGVEYSSGNGDYAEWLERSSPEEYINPGDIVGVIGGKISKDLANAEQVMAVSKKPIVLGNLPPEGKVAYGNNVAFMGQIPVKVMGPIASGDYIIGNARTPGYGIAKHPNDMDVNDYKYAVGRSWETNENSSPVLVNTVIGVHNGDFIKILKGYEEKLQKAEVKSDARFHALELKVEAMMGRLGEKADK